MTFASDESDNVFSPEEEEGAIELERSARWYAVQVASGCEKRVKMNLEQRIETLDVANRIVQIEIPQTPILKPQKGGKPKETAEKVFPGYVLIRMVMDDDTWQVVKNTPNVINFVGAEQKRRYGRGRGHVKPMPLGASEVERIFKQAQEQKPIVKIDMAAGDKILVLSGPFKDFEGEVIEVSPERSKLKALLSIFGRDTPVELEFNQVQKQS
ncbi:transcription termination/antitermination protein NusG [Oculatella sp. FACHB-28]|jgi:transcriptional antiterminator NusG|uniref:transcription termination/antitermination protein NusG n=1 Tax=Cyanophyceae TaxID=3028117 RepID=UPI0016857443|nr:MULTISPECIES: transcription termination/antitermination protein NusG [Cyanophyceae]MBD1869069.1 transcription termination/antitermination protein NusG [Cyanobacteria bacterium FACHB-471]MBD1996792.1 transcription termination/antitermination protein NusG [Leptolyngbya sp. FACHB-541]MBD2055495.1 transcription termination/antitermination protein NusG [Oculatella sp. FACHB-28]MBD2069861.1 transcription termination/antitermination protein NusG [Leptolyngbya sp. FACHB-671]